MASSELDCVGNLIHTLDLWDLYRLTCGPVQRKDRNGPEIRRLHLKSDSIRRSICSCRMRKAKPSLLCAFLEGVEGNDQKERHLAEC